MVALVPTSTNLYLPQACLHLETLRSIIMNNFSIKSQLRTWLLLTKLASRRTSWSNIRLCLKENYRITWNLLEFTRTKPKDLRMFKISFSTNRKQIILPAPNSFQLTGCWFLMNKLKVLSKSSIPTINSLNFSTLWFLPAPRRYQSSLSM